MAQMGGKLNLSHQATTPKSVRTEALRVSDLRSAVRAGGGNDGGAERDRRGIGESDWVGVSVHGETLEEQRVGQLRRLSCFTISC